MTNPYSKFSTKATPQDEAIPGSNQVPNNAGGFAWAVDDWTRLDRFLILGSEGGTYYVGERELTLQNAECVLRCIKADGPRTVARICEISEAGRAPKNDPALFALALAASVGDVATRQAALAALPKVARTGTHLFHFAEYVQQHRGWGRSLKRAVGNWYTTKAPDQLAYQLVKYRQRDGWSHRDLLRLSHPIASEPAHNAVLNWVTRAEGCRAPRSPEGVHRHDDGRCLAPESEECRATLPQLIRDFETLQAAKTAKEAIDIIGRNDNITHEMVPTTLLGEADVWGALLPNMPMTALVRNLGRMTANGLIKPMGTAEQQVVQALSSDEAIRKARVHPLSVLVALKTYQQGHGDKGSLTWQPNQRVTDALDAAFYKAFGNVTPTNKRQYLALDVSGSMGAPLSNSPITCREGSAAMAMVTARTEPRHVVYGFASPGGGRYGPYGGMHGGGDPRMVDVKVSPRQRLDDVIRTIEKVPMGGTDCSLPMRHALNERIEVDQFVVYTDSETWAGPVHPSQALAEYRRKMGIPAKLVVVGMVSNGFTIADPNDAGMLDVVGFDTATPQVISDFAGK